MKVKTKVKTNTDVKSKSLPKVEIKKYLTEDALQAVTGITPSFHTDGSKCDTSGGCNCGS